MTDWSYDAWAPVDDANWGEGRHDHPTEQDCHVDLGCGKIKKGRIGIDLRPAAGVNVIMDLNSGSVFAAAAAPNRDAAERLDDGWRYRTPGRAGYPDAYLDYWCMPLPQDAWGKTGAMPYEILRGLPFPDNSIKSIITHHCLEHVGAGFMPLMDDIYRVLEPEGTLRIIVPLFPSSSAVGDQDHCRYFMEDSFEAFCGTPGDAPNNCWLASFSVPYTRARFEMIDKDVTARCDPREHWTPADARELRVALKAKK